MTNTVKRIKVVTGYAAHARFTAECSDEFLGEIPRSAVPVKTPYSSGPSFIVWEWKGTPVVIAETGHRRYEIFAVAGSLLPVNTL